MKEIAIRELHRRTGAWVRNARKYGAILVRDRNIAMHAGKTLAGLFYLRTFVEQFARHVTGIQGKATGEEILDKYASGLPEDLRSRMPSLRDLYERLSNALHSAREDADLFEAAKSDLDVHFDIRRVHKVE